MMKTFEIVTSMYLAGRVRVVQDETGVSVLIPEGQDPVNASLSAVDSYGEAIPDSTKKLLAKLAVQAMYDWWIKRITEKVQGAADESPEAKA